MQSSSSTSVLLSSQPQSSSPKNWEASFGNLASSYGFGGGAPSLPHKSRSSQSTKGPHMPSSSTPVQHLPSSSISQAAGKDYQSSFGQLSATYGFGGGCYAPSFPAQHASSSKAPASIQQPPVVQMPQGYEAAYGKLASSHGFGGQLPSRR